MKRNQLFKLIAVSIILTSAVAYLHAFVVFNDIYPVFDSPDARNVETLTIDGTSYFLKSNADVFLLLNEVEIGYPNALHFQNALGLTRSALNKLNIARERYLQIINLASGSGYTGHKIQRLNQFNYAGFADSHNLDGKIMKQVELYFKHGDIIGLYRENIKNIDSILLLLGDIETQLSEGTAPPISSFWSLLQQFSSAVILGNYSTMVFNNM